MNEVELANRAVQQAEDVLAQAKRHAAEQRATQLAAGLTADQRAYAEGAGVDPARFALLQDVTNLDEFQAAQRQWSEIEKLRAQS